MEDIQYWYCPTCVLHIKEQNIRDLTLDEELLDYLEKGTPPSEEEYERIIRASTFLKFEDGILWICRDGKWLMVPTIAQRRELVEERHYLLRHAGAHAIVQSLRGQYYWVNMRDTAVKVIASCDAC